MANKGSISIKNRQPIISIMLVEVGLMRHKLAVAVTIVLTWGVLTLAMLAIDYLGVRVLNRNGLVFEVHIYWYGLSAFVGLAAFWIAVHFFGGVPFSLRSVLAVCATTSVWWFLTFCILMQFHGAIGGWY